MNDDAGACLGHRHQALLGRVQKRLKGGYWLVFAAISVAAFTAWDLYLDPQMVAREMWTWGTAGGHTYFGRASRRAPGD